MMKKALILSIFIHATIFATDLSINIFSKRNVNPLPVNPARGFSVELISDTNLPSIEVKKARKNTMKKYQSNKRSVRLKRKNMSSQSASRNRRSRVPFSGKQYKSWILEYYSKILKIIKIKMEKIGVSPGNIKILLNVQRNGNIKNVKIIKSDYSVKVENRIYNALTNSKLDKFPANLKNKEINFRLNVIYK